MPASKVPAAKTPKTKHLRLAAKLDQNATIDLVRALRERRGADLGLDASDTTHFGTLAVQAIISAARTWANDGHKLSLANVPDICIDQLSLLGLHPEKLVEGASQ